MTTNHHPNGLRPEGDLGAFAASLPTTSFDELYHVGTMDPTDKGRAAGSLEGDGLSVSMHPEEWERIARLGGNPTWVLTKEPNRFVRYHALGDGHHDALAAWAVERGYAQRATLWHVTWEDDDEGGPVSFVVDSEAAAAEEAELRDDDSVTIHTETGLVATPALTQRLGQHCHLGLVEDLAWVAFVGELADTVDLDGIWWDDRYDPAALSCPRGVIVPARVATFTAVRVD